jgi:bacteriorhodopsin
LSFNFVGAGIAMILLGYVGQFYEVTNLSALWIWGALSTVFYLVLLYLTWTEIGKALPNLPASAVGTMKLIRWIFIIFWSFYPIAYIIPAIWPTAAGVVSRQIIFTTADIVSKVIYGVLLTKVAMDISREEGYQPG